MWYHKKFYHSPPLVTKCHSSPIPQPPFIVWRNLWMYPKSAAAMWGGVCRGGSGAWWVTVRCGAQEQERAVSQQRSAREAEQERQWKQLQQMRQQQTQQQQQIIHDQRLQGSAISRRTFVTRRGRGSGKPWNIAILWQSTNLYHNALFFLNVIRLFWYLKIIFWKYKFN